jgi:DegV family protein with EDD domain
MARIAIVTDSTADLSAELRERHGITMVPLTVLIDDQSYRDQIDLTTNDFVERLRTVEVLPTTSQPSPDQFESAFRELAADHDAIVAVLLSSKLSATIQSATKAAEAVADLIPVEIVDSRTGTMSLGLQAIRAAELAQTDRPAPAIAAQLRAEVIEHHVVFFVDTLEYLQRGGRIGRAAALVGGLLQLKPLLRVDEGQIVPYERTRTRAKAITGLTDFVRGFPHVERIAAIHVSDPEEAEALADQFAEITSIPRDQVFVTQIGPVIGTHIGPGAMGVALFEGGQSRRG